jgi:dTMP kinase
MIIAIDGIDGTGKATQAKMLQEHFTKRGIKTKVVSFPMYGSFFGKMISEYLNGDYGSLYSVDPKLVSLLYAQDRYYYFQTHKITDVEIIIFDRYVNSNIAHQGSKVKEKDRKTFIDWITEFEYEINKIPKPDISFILDAEVGNSIKNVAKKQKREYTDATYDLHESDTEYLMETRKIFQSLANKINDTHLIKCDTNGVMNDLNDISKEILIAIGLLPAAAPYRVLSESAN